MQRTSPHRELEWSVLIAGGIYLATILALVLFMAARG